MKIKKAFDKQLFMIDCLVDIIPEPQNDEYQSIYYLKPKDTLILFDLWVDQDSKKKILTCSYDKILSVFKNRFDMKDTHIQLFIQNMILKYTNWGLVIPPCSRL